MKVSIMTTLENALRCQQAGFDELDIGLNAAAREGGPLTQDNWLEYAQEQVKIYREQGIRGRHSHAYFSKPLYSPMASEDFKREYVLFERVMRTAGMMGIPEMTVHPLRMAEYTTEQILKENVVFFHQIAEIAGEYNMRLAIENMIHQPFGTPDNVLRLLDMLHDDDMYGMCVDTGHAFLNGMDLPGLIRRAGSRLRHTHVHDNIQKGDAHSIPYWGHLDWTETMKAFGDIGYQGALNLEISVGRVPEPIRDSMLRYALDTARYLTTLAE